MKRNQFIVIYFLLILYLSASNVYAYSIETLDGSPDLQEIIEKEDDTLRWCGKFFSYDDGLPDFEIYYSRAVKIYVDTNIFKNEELTSDMIQDTLSDAAYIWEVPVKVSEDRYVTVTFSRKLPISEEMQQQFLKDGTYTEEELDAELAEVGHWTIPTASYDETQPDYIGRLNDVLGETFDTNDSNIVYLLGGTPNMRLPFGLFYSDGQYRIATLQTTAPESDTETFSIEDTKSFTDNNIYTFGQVQDVVSSLPDEATLGDTGLSNVPDNIQPSKHKKLRNIVIIVLLLTFIICIPIIGKCIKVKKKK